MADNITIPTTGTGTATPVVATEDIGGVHYQKIAIVLTDGTTINALLDAGQQLMAASLPVVLSSDHGDIKITLDGEAVTANLSATDNAVLDQIEVNTSYGDNTGGGTETGALRVTLANNSTGVLSVDDNGATLSVDDGAGSLTVDNGGTFAVQVDAALPAGTNAIGKLAANSGVDIGDVDVTSVTPGTGASNLGKAEDAAHTSGDVGVMPLAVRNDALAALAGTDGDYAPLQVDSEGALYTVEKSLVDSNNSSTSTLLSGAAFTGTGVEVTHYASVVISVEASHDSAADGLSFQFSSDNTNWDIQSDYTYTAANGGVAYALPIQAQYFRVVYTNGGTGQTHFRLETILHANAVLPVDGRLSDSVPPDRMGSLTKSAIIAQASGAGDFVPVQSTNGGSLKISLEEAGGLAGQKTMANSVPVVIASDQSAVTVDGSGVTQPVSAASLPLPTGASTATNQTTANTSLSNIETDTGNMDTSLNNIEAGYAAEGAALGSGVLLQGDDGTDRKNINVDATTGDVQVDVTNTVTVDGSGVTQPVSDAGGSLTVDNAALSTTGGGTEAAALRVTVANDSTGVLSVDDNGGSLTVDGTVTASNASGDVAHDTADSGNPVKTGHKAKNFDSTAPGTAVAEDDRVDSIADVYGRQYVETAHPNFWTVSADYASAQTNTTVKAAPGAGLRLYITDVVISNGATAGNITLLDGSGGTVLLELYPAVNGGMAMPFRTPIPLTANTLLAITSTTVTTHSVTINGYIAP